MIKKYDLSSLVKSIVIVLFAFNFTVGFSQTRSKLIISYLQTEREKNGWLPGDISDYIITDQYLDKASGIDHVYIKQRHHQIEVYNAISVFAVKENKIQHFSSGIIDHLENRVNSDKPVISPENAIGFALNHFGKIEIPAAKLIRTDNEKNLFTYLLPDISFSPVTVQLVYRKVDQVVLLAWDVSIDRKSDHHWWNVRIDALTGNYIDKNDYTVECNLGESSSTLFQNQKLNDECNSYASAFSMPASVSDYNIFPFPLEAPTFGSRVLLSDPSNATASPYGWHDINGLSGAEYTVTRGNNVHAYEDQNNDNLPGYSPDGGVNLHFDFPFAVNPPPLNNLDASLTNLFYVNNSIHDYLYPLGFDELSGSFQMNNYGKGGNGNDYVKAEGFDGSGTNNANFSTPPDGISGRMQMYLWTGNTAACTNLSISSSAFSGAMSVGTAAFSPAASVTANLILVNDAVGTVTDGCTSITNSISGKIALIDRGGSCSFVLKAQNALAAGAVGVIIANNVSGVAPGMTGTPTLTIPTVSVSQADGVILKNALLAGTVNATINTCVGNQIDADFDNGIITHEYAHGVSNRLTGGPSHTGCLSNGEQGGEGWSDYFALMMTIEPGDHGTDSRGMATYSKGQVPTGAGIRRFPYSTNMSINPQTYASLATNTEVHAIGEIWCDVIWDMSWLFIDQYGFNADPTVASAGNNIALRLVIEGMKLQPCSPGFLDARDAILTADALLYGNIHRCMIWQAFARRGMGFNALQGSANVAGDETQGFTLPPYCSAPTQIPVAAFTSNVSSISCGGKVKFTDASIQAFEWAWDFGDLSTSTLQNPSHIFTAPGTYTVTLLVTNPLGNNSVSHTVTVTQTFSVSVTASPTTICSSDSVQLNAVASGTPYRSYTVSNIPYAPLSGTGTSVTLTDDQVSSVQPIGFTFNFFGQNYTNFYISSNGLITFSSGMPAQPVYGEVIPYSPDPNNFIALAWNDLNPQNAGSSISYFNTGLSPNRKLVVKFTTSHYGGTAYPFVVQAILYEGSNLVEIHTTSISDASAFDESATTTQGLENADGSDGVTVPGRNGTIFSASNDAYRFTQYIPYSYTWIPGNLIGASQTVHPTASGIYTVKATDGTACVMSASTPMITVNSCTLALNLKVFIQGFYSGNGTLQPVLYTTGLSSNPVACDSITIELHNSSAPFAIYKSNKILLNTSGFANLVYPADVIGNSYYIVVRSRNSIETWSKNPILFNNALVEFDFTTP